MDQPFLMLRTRLTSDVIAGIKVEVMDDSINTVTEEWNTFNVSDIRQGGSTYHMDHMKVERYSPNIGEIDENNTCDNIDINEEGMSQNMENIRQSFTSDIIDIKGETDDYILDIKEEGISENMENITNSFTSGGIDIKVETDDYIQDVKEEGISQNMDNEENDGCSKARINVSENMDTMSESYSCVGFETKEQDTDLDIDDIKKEGIYHLSGNNFILCHHGRKEYFYKSVKLQVYILFLNIFLVTRFKVCLYMMV